MENTTAVSSFSEYPKASDLEQRFARMAARMSDSSPRPVCVTVVPVNGGKPPMYAVVLRSREKEQIRQQLSQILERQLCLGVTAFSLQAAEARRVIDSADPEE
jgi:hypothetical protein